VSSPTGRLSRYAVDFAAGRDRGGGGHFLFQDYAEIELRVLADMLTRVDSYYTGPVAVQHADGRLESLSLEERSAHSPMLRTALDLYTDALQRNSVAHAQWCMDRIKQHVRAEEKPRAAALDTPNPKLRRYRPV
jgi:hypothetical protein